MRRSYSAREFDLMFAELRARPPQRDETIYHIRERLHAAVDAGCGRRFNRTHAPELFVVREVLKSGGHSIPPTVLEEEAVLSALNENGHMGQEHTPHAG